MFYFSVVGSGVRAVSLMVVAGVLGDLFNRPGSSRTLFPRPHESGGRLSRYARSVTLPPPLPSPLGTPQIGRRYGG